MRKLTMEQESIIKLVVQGRTNMQIAEELGYSERSIKRRLRAIYKAYSVDNRQSLVREAILH